MIGQLVGTSLTTMGPSTVAPGYLIQNLITLGDDVFWTKGKHALQMGFLLNHFDDPMWNDLIFGSVNVMPDVFAGVPIGGETYGDFLGDSILQGYALAQSFERQPPVPSYTNARLHLLDGRRLSAGRLADHPAAHVNLGLRYEPMTVPSDKSGRNSGLHEYRRRRCVELLTDKQPLHLRRADRPYLEESDAEELQPEVGIRLESTRQRQDFGEGRLRHLLRHRQHRRQAGPQAIMAPPFSYIENVLANYGNETPPEFPAEGPPLVGGNFPFWPFEIPHNVNPANGYCSPSNAGWAPWHFMAAVKQAETPPTTRRAVSLLRSPAVSTTPTEHLHSGVQPDDSTAVAGQHGGHGGLRRLARHSPAPGRRRQPGRALQHAQLDYGQPPRLHHGFTGWHDARQPWLGTTAKLRFSMGSFIRATRLSGIRTGSIPM